MSQVVDRLWIDPESGISLLIGPRKSGKGAAALQFLRECILENVYDRYVLVGIRDPDLRNLFSSCCQSVFCYGPSKKSNDSVKADDDLALKKRCGSEIYLDTYPRNVITFQGKSLIIAQRGTILSSMKFSNLHCLLIDQLFINIPRDIRNQATLFSMGTQVHWERSDHEQAFRLEPSPRDFTSSLGPDPASILECLASYIPTKDVCEIIFDYNRNAMLCDNCLRSFLSLKT